MDVSVHHEHGLEVLDQAKDGNEADVRRILRVGQTVRRRVRDEDVELAAGFHPFESDAELEFQGAPSTSSGIARMRSGSCCDTRLKRSAVQKSSIAPNATGW